MSLTSLVVAQGEKTSEMLDDKISGERITLLSCAVYHQPLSVLVGGLAEHTELLRNIYSLD